jgi:hypothetical protein
MYCSLACWELQHFTWNFFILSVKICMDALANQTQSLVLSRAQNHWSTLRELWVTQKIYFWSCCLFYFQFWAANFLCNFSAKKGIHQDCDQLEVFHCPFIFRLYATLLLWESLAQLCPAKTHLSLTRKACLYLTPYAASCVTRYPLLKFHVHSTKEVTLKTSAADITVVVYTAWIYIHLWIFIFWGGGVWLPFEEIFYTPIQNMSLANLLMHNFCKYSITSRSTYQCL